MREIELTQGQKALVDDVDFEFLIQWKWHARWNPTSRGYYARRTESHSAARARGGSRRTILMHRAVAERMGLEITGLDVDHIDRRSTLDNRRSNLRAATRSQGNMNQGASLGSTSRFKGVSWHKRDEKWDAKINKHGKRYHLGYFTDEADAARAYDRAAARLFGQFAVFNFPNEYHAA